MKLIDRNGRLFGKISVIDLLVIAVVLIMAAALYSKNTKLESGGTSSSDTTITYQLLVRGARNYVADAVQTGDSLYDPERPSGGSLGEITDIQILPCARPAEFQDGTIDFVPAEDSVNLLITAEGSGLVSDGRCLLNRIYDLGVNSNRMFSTKYVQFTAVVTDIQTSPAA